MSMRRGHLAVTARHPPLDRESVSTPLAALLTRRPELRGIAPVAEALDAAAREA